MENLGTSLWITFIGMGLVFIAIILLWGLMALLVRITNDKPQKETFSGEIIGRSSENTNQLKSKAAVAAVAIALATSASSTYQGAFSAPSDTVSTWQSANRNHPA